MLIPKQIQILYKRAVNIFHAICNISDGTNNQFPPTVIVLTEIININLTNCIKDFKFLLIGNFKNHNKEN